MCSKLFIYLHTAWFRLSNMGIADNIKFSQIDIILKMNSRLTI